MYILGFFDYKDKIENFQSEMFSLNHIIYMIISLIFLIVLPIIFRKTNHQKISKFLKVNTFIVIISDIIKIVWETYHYYPIHHSYEYTGLLPLYLCSLFMITLPFAAFCKGKLKDISLAFLTTVGIIGGLSNVFYLNILNYYPLFHFASLLSIFYHFMMAFTGIWLLTSGYYKLDKYCSLKAFIPIILLSMIAIPVNIKLNTDYMLLNHAYGIPFYPQIADFFISHNVHYLFIIFMFITYILIGYFIYGLYNLIKNKCNKKKRYKDQIRSIFPFKKIHKKIN